MNRISKPTSAQGSRRVSPTAIENQSTSNNIWRMLESDPSFVVGMNEAAEEKQHGGFKPFRHSTKPRTGR